MDKKNKILIAIVIIVLIIALVVVFLKLNDNQKEEKKEAGEIKVSSVEDLTSLLDKVYEKSAVDIYEVENRVIDLSDDNSVKNAQAYSLIMAKVKDGVNANEIAKEMSEKIDTRKWICVKADKLYATNSRDIVFLIMTNEEMANGVYDSFKSVVGTIGSEYEKTDEEEELSEDLSPSISFPVPE